MSKKDVREWKSNTFSMLMNEPKYALEVYNALNGSYYTDPGIVEVLQVDGGVSLSVRHDAAFIIDTTLNLYEHQSTACPNMPHRFLIYVAECVKKLLKNKHIYGSTLLKIPEPVFVVFYNGSQKMDEDEVELRLSDAYFNKTNDPALELKCTVYNINKGHNEDLKKSSAALNGYMQYTAKVKRYSKDESIGMANAIEKAIDECIEEGVLAEFFRRNKHMIIENDLLDCTYERQLELMNLEMEKLEKEKSALNAALQEKVAALNAALKEKDTALQEKDVALQEKDVTLQEKDAALQAAYKEIEELKRKIP